jgi:hypothetical protein
VKSVISDAVIAGYAPSNFDSNLVFSMAAGTDDCKTQNTTTGVLNSSEAGEDRSGMNHETASYGFGFSYPSDVDFQAGVAANLVSASSHRFVYADRPEFDLYFNKPFVLELEIKFTSFLANAGIVTQYNSATSYGWQLTNDDTAGALRFLIRNSAGTTIGDAITSIGFVTTGTYYILRIVGLGDGSAPKIYKRTSLLGAETEATYQSTAVFASGNTSSAAQFHIGRNINGTYVDAKIGYVKMSNGASSFNYAGFKSQPPLVGIQNLGHKILTENKVGLNSNTSGVNFDNVGIVDGEYANTAAVVDSNDLYIFLEKDLENTTGQEMHLKATMNRANVRNQSSIQGIAVRYSK